MSKILGARGDPAAAVTLSDEQIAAAEEAGASETELRHILSLKQRAAEFQTAFDNLESWGPTVRGTELEAEWRELRDRGATIRARVSELMAQIDNVFSTVVSWFRRLVSYLPGVDGLRAIGPAGLGVVWFIPVAAIVAVLGLLGFWLADYSRFARRFAEQQRIAQELTAQGVNPVEAQRQAALAVADTAPQFLAPLGKPLMLIGVGVGAYLLWQWWQGSRQSAAD